MKDLGVAYADNEIADLEKKFKVIYSEAQADIEKKIVDFEAKYAKKDAKYQKQLKNKEITQEQYNAWKKGQVFTGKQWAAKKDEITKVLNNSNKIATALINNSAKGVFGENGNFMAYSLEHSAGVNFGFGLYNIDAVTKLIKDDPKLLPEWKIDQKKDYIWNQKNLNNALNQGIIQGESLDQISKRVSSGLAGKNENLMKTFAKTGMTQAQNSGRLTRIDQAVALGINAKKKWVATLDGHTRTSHRILDGQIVKPKESFEAEGMHIAYPGDPEAPASMVYNCRCAITAVFDDYPATYNRYDNISGVPVKSMSYSEWKLAKETEQNIAPVPLTFKQFKTADQEVLTELFKSKSMSALYNEIKDLEKPAANKFYSILGENGKPSENWNKYLEGTLPKAQTKKLDELLKTYGYESGLITDPVSVAEMFEGKKMSNVFNEIKAIDKTSANKFYNELKGMGKPSEVWDKYLAGELSTTDAKKIEAYLENYLKKTEAAASTKIDKTALLMKKYGVDDLGDLVDKLWDDETILDFAVEGKMDSKYKTMWNYLEAYAKGEIVNSDIDEYLKLGSNAIKTTKVAKTTKAATTKVAKTKVPKAADGVTTKVDTSKILKAARYNPNIEKMLEIEEKTSDVFTKEEVAALKRYTGSAYTKMNKYLRFKATGMSEAEAMAKAGLTSDLKKEVELCEKALSKVTLDRDLVLRRGTDLGDLAGLFMDGDFDANWRSLRNKTVEELAEMFEGKTGMYAGFTSTSSQWDKGFDGLVEIIFNAPKGTHASSIMKISRYGIDEGETLLNANTKVICDKIEESDGHMNSKIRVFLTIIN